jgi:hypothetical protein
MAQPLGGVPERYIQGLLERCLLKVVSRRLGDVAQWLNKHLLLPLTKNKGKDPKMKPRLKVLIKRVTDLCQDGLEACHCDEEFMLQ